MADISTVWRGVGGDWQIVAGALRADDDLSSAILISLFSDRAAAPGDPVTEAAGKRDWWANGLDDGPALGSRLWQLRRAKRGPDVPRLAQDYAAEALAWMVTDGVVATFDIQAEYNAQGWLTMLVLATAPDGTKTNLQIDDLWRQLDAIRPPGPA